MIMDEYAEFCIAHTLPASVGVSFIGDSIDQAAGAVLTAGKVRAFLTPDASQWAATADGVI